jgi:cytochrome P450
VVGINSWVAHRNPDVFGADVDKFIPERWLVDDETYKRMDRYFMAVRSSCSVVLMIVWNGI